VRCHSCHRLARPERTRCAECATKDNGRSRRWQAANPERFRALNTAATRRYKATHPQQGRKDARLYYARHQESAKARHRRWLAAHVEHVKRYSRSYKARLKEAEARAFVFPWFHETPGRVSHQEHPQ
jgi:hypothetical protein